MTTTGQRSNHAVSDHRAHGAIRHLEHRGLRAERHRQVRRLLPSSRSWLEQFTAGMVFGVILFVAIVGAVVGAYLLIQLVNRIFGGN